MLRSPVVGACLSSRPACVLPGSDRSTTEHGKFLVRLGCRFGCCPGILNVVADPDVYPSAPVVLVTLELRHPVSDRLANSEQRALKRLLSDHTPILRTGQMQTLQLTSSNAGADQQIDTEHFPRFVNRAGTLTISYRQTALVVEATAYPGWDKFSAIVTDALKALVQVSPVDAVERIGLRYIDEVRVPDDEPAIDWAQWLAPSVMAPNPPEDVALPLAQWQGVSIYGAQPGQMMLLRYGPQNGVAVNFEGGDLRRAQRADPGPFFLIDIDSFWTPTEGLPEVDVERVMTTCDEIHQPVRRLFESLVTDKLRDEVFRK